MFNSEKTKTFYDSWHDLRGEKTAPHYRDLFDGLSPDLIPQMVMLEAAPDGRYILRFVGTALTKLWGDDPTDGNLGDTLPGPGMDNAGEVLTAVRTYPCGASSTAQFQTAQGTLAEADLLTLPVANDPGLPDRVVIFCGETPPENEDTMIAATARKMHRTWIDIGFGTPD